MDNADPAPGGAADSAAALSAAPKTAPPAGPISRRGFLKLTGAAGAALAVGRMSVGPGTPRVAAQLSSRTPTPTPTWYSARATRSYNMRVAAAQAERNLGFMNPTPNGDENLYPSRFANFSKALPHDALGVVTPAAYTALLTAVQSGLPADFDRIPLGGTLKLTNPQAGLSFVLQGADGPSIMVPAAPTFAGAEQAADMAENYWRALARDIPFASYETSSTIAAACADLSTFTAYRGPKVGGQVTPATVFRGAAPGATAGPFISQFLLRDTPFGSERVERRMRTSSPGHDYLTSYSDWLAAQNGNVNLSVDYDPVPRYIRSGRDMGEWVHFDVLFQAYFDAMLILFALRAPLDPGNPYVGSPNQTGFGVLGDPYIASVLCAVARNALVAQWHQKWFVHRRLRPEEYGGRVHNHLSGAASYPLHPELLASPVLGQIHGQYGSYLLPMGFSEGCPSHPSYGAGHATVAGACVTVLKAMFNESWVLPDPVAASADGLSLAPYTGPDPLTVGGELNKLATNVAHGRDFAGVHWRSDGPASLWLGEEVAIRYLRQEKSCMNEPMAGYSLTRFDGTTITV